MRMQYISAFFLSKLCFYEILNMFISRCKCTYEGERDGVDESSILGIAVALFIIAIRAKLNLQVGIPNDAWNLHAFVDTNIICLTDLHSFFLFQKSVHLLKDVISSEWIQPNGLKYLYVSLYNIGVILYRNKQLKEVPLHN